MTPACADDACAAPSARWPRVRSVISTQPAEFAKRTRSHDDRARVLLPILATLLALGGPPPAQTKIPLLYSTDLHHPHMDPDDHFDLATLFGLSEFEVRGIVLDCGAQQQKAPGSIPLDQMLHLTNRKVPFAIGLSSPLRSAEDPADQQSPEFQHGVELILGVLREATSPVTLFTTGSLRDVAAAYNREPELLRRKVGRLYANIGNPATGYAEPDNEYNVQLDREAYVRIMNSDLPVYWCPCFDGNLWQRGRHGTYWNFTQAAVLDPAPLRLQNWFLFALIKPPDVDPLAYLTQPQDVAVREVIWKATRNMWCTAPMLHAAGRAVYARGPQDYVALPPAAAQELGLADRRVEVFAFVPMKATAVRQAEGSIRVQLTLDPPRTGAFVFESRGDQYEAAMTTCLRSLFHEVGR